MIQSLLAERAGRGGGVIDLGHGSLIGYGRDRLEAKKVTLSALAGAVERLLDRPVVDMTGIGGAYDFSLEYSWEELRSLVRSSSGGARELPANADSPGNSIFTPWPRSASGWSRERLPSRSSSSIASRGLPPKTEAHSSRPRD
jgi:uncharacterized protein (TIGR03435 family)